MSKFSRITADKFLVWGCILIIFVILPATLFYWSSHPEAEQQAAQTEQAALPVSVEPPQLPENSGPPPVPAGTPAPDFKGTEIGGKSFTFNSQTPGLKIVDFWATWCGPCRMSIPALEDLHKTLGIEVVGVSVDTDTASQVPAFAQTMQMNYTVLSDPGGNQTAAAAYNASALPSLFIIDGKGIVRWSFSGYWPDEENYIRQVISEIKSGQPVS